MPRPLLRHYNSSSRGRGAVEGAWFIRGLTRRACVVLVGFEHTQELEVQSWNASFAG